MTLTSADLWKRIAASGIASGDETRQWAAELAQSLSASELADGNALMAKLVAERKVTDFQANAIINDHGKTLKRGIWLLCNRCEHDLWQGWYEARAGGQTRLVRWLADAEVQKLKQFCPSWDRAEQLCKIAGAGLFPLASIVAHQGAMQLVHPQVPGSLLSVKRRKEATEMVRGIATALASLHAANIVHGRVMPDRVLVKEDGSIGLVVDPICSNTSRGDGAGNCGVFPRLLPAGIVEEQFVAPEFTSPGHIATPASDVYALGCLWWFLATGRPLVPAMDSVSMMGAHCETLPGLPPKTRLSADEIQCLRHCLSRNLEGRFRNAGQLLAALDTLKDPKATTPSAVSDAAATSQVPNEIPPTTVSVEPSASEASSSEASSSEASSSEASSSEASASEASSSEASPSSMRKSQASRKPSRKQTPDKPVAARPAKVETSTVLPKVAQPLQKQPSVKAKTQPEAPAPKVPQPSTASAPPVAKTTSGEPEETQKEPRLASEPGKAARMGAKRDAAKVSPSTSSETPSKESVVQAVSIADKPSRVDAESPVSESPVAGTPDSKATAASGRLASTTSAPRRRRKKKTNKWMLPVIGGCGFLILLLAILKLSGALEPSREQAGGDPVAPYQPKPIKDLDAAPKEASRFYDQRASNSGNLWMPPRDPEPWATDHLPPGAQLFVHVHPDVLDSELAGLLQPILGGTLDSLKSNVGVGLDAIQMMNVAFYPPLLKGGPPQLAYRVTLADAVSQPEFAKMLDDAPAAQLSGVDVFASQDYAYWPFATGADDSVVNGYTVTSIELMKEAVELGGDTAPMLPAIESLWKLSDRESSLSVLVAPSFLFSEGRWLIESSPPRLAGLLRDQLEDGIRGGLLQISQNDRWYSEVLLVSESAPAAALLSEKLSDDLKRLPTDIEDWFVNESPDPHWAAIAFRFPQMLRSLASYTRTGVEGGVTVVNTYLPTEAAENLVLASSIALQPTATVAGTGRTASEPIAKPLTVQEYLDRKIRRINFAQEPIEVALALIGDEANDGIPIGTPKYSFILDGDAFEEGGITRNQQLSDFDFSNVSVRDALTEVAKRGNPVTTVTDTRDLDQRLIWIVRGGDTQEPKILLTTRAAATAAGDPLSAEFSP